MKSKMTRKINQMTSAERQPVYADPSHRIGSSLRLVFVVGTKYAALGAIFCFIGVNIALGEQPQKIVPLHHFPRSCDSCHVRESSDSANKSEATNGVGKVKDDINRLCTSAGCHDYDAVLDHPVGIRPKGKIPANMPLDNRSRITCLTCHEAPESSGSPDPAYLGLQRSLQRPPDVEFCAKCHIKRGGTLLEQSH